MRLDRSNQKSRAHFSKKKTLHSLQQNTRLKCFNLNKQNKWVGPRKRKWEIESTERGSQREEAILWRKVVPFLWHTQQEHPERLAEPWLCIPISYLSQLFGAKKVSAKNNKKKKKKKKKRIWKRKKGCMWRLGHEFLFQLMMLFYFILFHCLT